MAKRIFYLLRNRCLLQCRLLLVYTRGVCVIETPLSPMFRIHPDVACALSWYNVVHLLGGRQIRPLSMFPSTVDVSVLSNHDYKEFEVNA
jgi:hypothetical protein